MEKKKSESIAYNEIALYSNFRYGDLGINPHYGIPSSPYDKTAG